MPVGTVKWFNPEKRFGFISPEGGGQDVFVHISALNDAGLSALEPNARVEYELEEHRGRQSAVKLKLIS